METINKICVYLVATIVAIIIGYLLGTTIKLTQPKQHFVIDTIYTRVVLDSIEYNIKRKDSTIIKFKKQMKYEVEQANDVSDSDAIELFNRLAREN